MAERGSLRYRDITGKLCIFLAAPAPVTISSMSTEALKIMNGDPDCRAIAEAIGRRGMITPAIFFLEAHKPLTSIVNFSAQLCAPLLLPLFGRSKMEEISRLLEEPGKVEALIQELERLRESGQN